MRSYGTDQYNQNVYEEVEPTLGVNCGISTGRNGVIIMENVEVYGLDLLAGRGGANYTEDISPTLVRGDRTTHGVVYAIDQQGGKGNANYAEDVMPTLCSDSHGTPHAVAFEIE